MPCTWDLSVCASLCTCVSDNHTLYIFFAIVSVSYFLAPPPVFLHLYVCIPATELTFLIYVGIPLQARVDILFSHKHAVEVKYVCDVFKSTAIAFCYLNDNFKEITIKMIPYKYALSRGSSPEL